MDREHPESSHPELSLRTPGEGAVPRSPTASDQDSDEPSRQPAIFEFDDARDPDGGKGRRGGRSGARADASGSPPNDRAGSADAEEEASSEGSGVTGASDEMFERAKEDWRAGREADALRRYRKLVAMDPGHVRARNNLGVLLDRTGAHEVALEQFQAALEIEPDNPEVLTNYGAALAALGQYDQAEAQLRRAMRIDPGRTDVRANLGILYFRRGLYAQSESELGWVCEQDPEHGTAHFYRGEALNRLGRVDEALETLERASHLQPDRARIYYLLGILYDRKHLRQEAAVMYRKARELSDP